MNVEKVLRRLAKLTCNNGAMEEWLYSAFRESGLEEALRAGQAMRDDERSRMENTSRANKPLKRTTAVTLWDSAARKLEGQ